MKFKIGDRFCVTTERWNRSNFTQSGKIGTILRVRATWYVTKLDDGEEDGATEYNYEDGDIDPIGPAPLSDQEYQDVFLGQELYAKLEER